MPQSRSGRSWWQRLFGSDNSSDVETESTTSTETEVQPSNAEVNERVTEELESSSSEEEVSILEEAVAEIETEANGYKIEEDTYISADEAKSDSSSHGGALDDLAPGTQYKLTASDMEGGGSMRDIARNFGTTEEKLAAFNEGVTELAVGTTLYIPSAEERRFAEYRMHYKSLQEAAEAWQNDKGSIEAKVYEAASDRATGDVGESYGTKGVEGGKFYTPNPDVAGASKRRSKEVNGQTEYAVYWLSDFWKCSIFMNDVVWQAGYKPALTGNNHYSTAGRAHEQTTVYEEVDVKDAKPGDAWQRFGGRGSDQSHNAILSSFVEIEDGYNESTDTWKFSIIGAESGRAAEGEKTKTMDKGTNKTTDGKVIRFLRPKAARSDA